MDYTKYNINGKLYNITPAVELIKQGKWEGTVKYLTQVVGVDQNTAERIRMEIDKDANNGINNKCNNEPRAEETKQKKMEFVNNIEDIYSLDYRGTKLDISAILIHIKNGDESAIKYLTDKDISKVDASQILSEVKTLSKENPAFSNDGAGSVEKYSFLGEPIYSIDGNRGRHLDVYEEFIVITVSASVGSLITGNVFDGKKIIFYSDCIGIQFKEPGVAIGYLQIETAAATMNNKSNNFFNENTFTYNDNFKEVFEAYKYIFNKVKEIKTTIKSI